MLDFSHLLKIILKEAIKKELFWFEGVNTFVLFYLINEKTNKIFMDDSWIFVMGCNYRKYVRRIN